MKSMSLKSRLIVTGALAAVFTAAYFAGQKIVQPAAKMLKEAKGPYVEIAPEKVYESSEMYVPINYPVPPVPENKLEQKVISQAPRQVKQKKVLQNPYNDNLIGSINEAVIKSQEMYSEEPVIISIPQDIVTPKEEALKSGYEINEKGEAVPVR